MVSTRVTVLLQAIECRDVYEFLNLNRNATPRELQEAAEKEKQRIHNKGMRGPIWDNRKALADICITIFKNEESKRDYDRTLNEAEARGEPEDRGGRGREFDEATALLASGWGLITQGRTDEALAVAKGLTGDNSEYSRFRSTLAGLLISGKKYHDAVDFLSWCEVQEPASDQYKAMLGVAFAKAGTQTWTKHEGTIYATTAVQVSEASSCLDYAREHANALGRRDDSLFQEIALLEESIRIATRKKWNGNALTVVGAVLVSQFLFSSPEPSLGFLMLASAAVYGISSMDPQWKFNARALNGTEAAGCFGSLVQAPFILMLLPVVAGWKFLTNFLPHYKEHGAGTSSQGGRSALVIAGVGLLALTAAGFLPFLSSLGEPATESGGEESISGGGTDESEPPAGGLPSGQRRPPPRTAVPDPPIGGGPVGQEGGTTAPPPSFDRSARRGIQGGLKAAGFYPGVVDGLFGPGTRGAIRDWQTARGVEATGYLDEAQAGELMVLAEPSGAAPPRVDASATDAGEGRLIVDELLPAPDLELSADTHEVEVRVEGYAPVEASVDVLPGRPSSLDITLEGEVSLAAARSRFDAGDYEAAADTARALLQMQADDGPAHLVLGRALYALGRFEDSIEPLRRAIALGERVELDARHRHGVGEFRQGFCAGELTFGGGEVTFRSEEEGSHDFFAAADRITDVEVVESIDGQPFWLTSRVQDRGSQRRRVDFVHRNVSRQFRSGNSRFSAILVCSSCDGSLGVQAALMRAGG